MFTKFTSIFQHVVGSFSPNAPEEKGFAVHWRGVTNYFMQNKEHRVSVDQTDIPADLDGMLTSLATEDAESLGAGDDGVGWVSGPCMEHLLRYNILETLYTLARTDCPPGMKHLVLQFFTKLLSRIRQPLLPHVHVYKPVQKMVRLCGEVRAGPCESEEVLFLCTVCAMLAAQPHLVSFFVVQPATDNGKGADGSVPKPSFHLVDSLLKLVNSADARVGVKACEGLLLCTTLPLAAEPIVAHTQFCEKLATCLATLYARLPPKLPPSCIDSASANWGLDLSAVDEGGAGQRSLLSFLSWLDYCDQLCQVALPHVAAALASAVGRRFLVDRLKPALLQTCEAGAVTTTCLITRCIHLLSSTLLLKEFTEFMFGAESSTAGPSSDADHTLRKRLVARCNDLSDELSIVSLRLFEELFRKPPPGPAIRYLVLEPLLGRAYTTTPPPAVVPPGGGQANRDLCDDVRLARDGRATPVGDSPRVCPVAPSGGDAGDGGGDAAHSRNDSGEEKPRRFSEGGTDYAPTDWRDEVNSCDIHQVVGSFLSLIPEHMKSSYQSADTGYDMYLRDAHRQFNEVSGRCASFDWPLTVAADLDHHRSKDVYAESHFFGVLFDRLSKMLDQSYDLNLQLTSVVSRLALLPHPHLHEILLTPGLALRDGCRSLPTVLAKVASEAESRLHSVPNSQVQLLMTRKGLLGLSTNLRSQSEPQKSSSCADVENVFAAVIVLEEFCKELAAIVFVKYHGAI